MRRPLVRRAAVAAVVVLGAWLALAAARPAAPTARVHRGALEISVKVTGRLAARTSSRLSPPVIPRMYQFKISFLAPDGASVKKGQPVIRFDGTEVAPKLTQAQADLDKAAKELEQKKAQIDKERADDALALAEAEARLRKARLKADVPTELTASLELAKARLALDLAQQEVAQLGRRIDASRQADDLEVDGLERVRVRAAERVEQLQRATDSLTVRAPRDGIMVLIEDWRGNKLKVGDSTWVGRSLAEIPDLASLEGDGEVPEGLAGHVAPGQRVRLALDALPGTTLSGSVRTVLGSVHRRSEEDPSPVVDVRIGFDTVDVAHMRPGMRFRGEIVTERANDVVLLPLGAVRWGADGPEVVVWTLLGWRRQPVRLGRATAGEAEVLEGPRPGARVRVAANGGGTE